MRATGREKAKYDAGDTEGFHYTSGPQGFRFEYGTHFSSSFNKIFSEVLYLLIFYEYILMS